MTNPYTVEKEFRDFADDIEAVSIHYLCTPTGLEADWDAGRVTRSMPIVEPGVRRLQLRLPAQIVDPRAGRPTRRYTLLHYFEVFRGGDRHYSQVYDEIIDTRANSRQVSPDVARARPKGAKNSDREIR
jgi:hypothetical protein